MAEQLRRILRVMLDEREFLSPHGIRAAEEAVRSGIVSAEAGIEARDLVNTPANHCTPEQAVTIRIRVAIATASRREGTAASPYRAPPLRDPAAGIVRTVSGVLLLFVRP